ncbi:MAG TPA: helix-turn-helix domain-containing protein [Bacteroidia bacterium]|nr:helix-turn-helix domain-containing protein [Bacteroidia bacterium]
MTPEENILQTAVELFFKYGIKSVTMDDIAKQLSMSKKTIYNYYSNKNEIVLALTSAHFKNNICECEMLAKNSKDAVFEMVGMMHQISVAFAQMNPTVVYDLQKYHPEAWQLFKNFKEKNISKLMEDNLKKGIEQGLYRNEINIKVLVRLRLEEVEMASTPSIYDPNKFDLKEVQLELLNHFLHGITTIKGHKLITRYKKMMIENAI